MKLNLILRLFVLCLLESQLRADVNSVIVMNWQTNNGEENDPGAKNHSLKVLETFYLKCKDNLDSHFGAIQRQLYYNAVFSTVTESNRPDKNIVLWNENVTLKVINSDEHDKDKARQHFIAGTTLFKDVHSPSDYNQVVEEFSKAVELNPKMLDAHYNLALVLEAQTDSRPLNRDAMHNDMRDKYMMAILHLRIYLDWMAKITSSQSPKDPNPIVFPDSERVKIQDKIYQLKAKAQKAQDYVAPPLELAVPSK
jgi:hypothetical protein